MRRQRVFGAGKIGHPALSFAPAASVSFIACPILVAMGPAVGGGWAQEVYRLAYEQARAALRPTWYDSARRPCPN